MNERAQVVVGAVVGAFVGAAAAYFFFTDRGRTLRERIDPAIDEARREFARFQGTILTAAELATDGLRMVNEFNQKGAQSSPTRPFSH